MYRQNLIIFQLPVFYNILNEIKSSLNFGLFYMDKEKDLENIDEKKFGNYLICVENNYKHDLNNNKFIINQFPIKLNSFIEKINISFLKIKYIQQSEIKIKKLYLNLNSREIFNERKKLKLTERETEIILFLSQNKTGKTISQLQKEVWGHNSNLETHTVETHIYRLRKKISENFNDETFIVSTNNGYKI